MKVKILTSQIFLKKLKVRDDEKRYKLINRDKWENFKAVFGEKETGFILAGDLLNEIKTGKKAPVYGFRENLYPYQLSQGVDCDLFLLSSLSPTENGFCCKEDMESMTEYIENQRNFGNIGDMVNSAKGTLSEDKISILELQARGIPTPPTYYFPNIQELEDFFYENPGNFIIKHRFGQGGEDLFRFTEKNFEEIKGLDIENYIVQKEINISDEKRLIFFQGELLGSRRIFDRHMPWEKEGKAGRKHMTEKYNPTKEEIEETRGILNLFDADLGCIDWINVNGNRLYMEYNGVGTGLGIGKYGYNLNRTVAEKLKEKFL